MYFLSKILYLKYSSTTIYLLKDQKFSKRLLASLPETRFCYISYRCINKWGFYIRNVTFKKIMTATDGSVCSRLAANKGIELARLSRGTVYAVYVISTKYFSSMAVDFDWERIHEALEQEGNEAVNYVKGAGEIEGVIVEPILFEGNPADELIRYAEEEKWILLLWTLLAEQELIDCF